MMTSVSSTHPPATPRRWLRRIILTILGVLVVAIIALQLIPVNRTNPPVITQLKWDSPQTEALARRACMDCHSNETVWPWYSYVAPMSWLVYYEVQRGRSRLNLSTLGAAEGTPPNFNGDLAYQLGQKLAGEDRRGPGEGRFPGGEPGGPPGGEPGGRPRGVRADDLGEQIQSNRMPPGSYMMLHPSANLSADERQQLIQGLTATLGQATALISRLSAQQ